MANSKNSSLATDFEHSEKLAQNSWLWRYIKI